MNEAGWEDLFDVVNVAWLTKNSAGDASRGRGTGLAEVCRCATHESDASCTVPWTCIAVTYIMYGALDGRGVVSRGRGHESRTLCCRTLESSR